jgi:hypothetical protein
MPVYSRSKPRRARFANRLAVLAGGLSACEPCLSVAEVSVTGALSASGVATWRAMAESWERDVGVGRVCLTRVSFGESAPTDWSEVELPGLYDVRRRSIEFRNPGGAQVATAHELCHALDYQQGLDHLEAELPALRDDDLLHDDGLRDWIQAPEERFAVWCEAGPHHLTLVAQVAEACGVPDVARAAEDVRAAAYPAADVAQPRWVAPTRRGGLTDTHGWLDYAGGGARDLAILSWTPLARRPGRLRVRDLRPSIRDPGEFAGVDRTRSVRNPAQGGALVRR